MKTILLSLIASLVLLSCTKNAQSDLLSASRTTHSHKKPVVVTDTTTVYNLSAIVVDTTVSLTWDAVPNATSYWIFRNDIMIAIYTTPYFVDSYPLPGTSTYAVAPVINSTLCTKSQPVTVTY